jgi:nicotinate-nucleotide adenylyltransferase
MNIGILGGAFDPIHNGHLALCKAAFEKLPIQKIFIIPSYNHPFKGVNSFFTFEQKSELINLGISEYFQNSNQVVLLPIEKETPNENYTYQTLEKLKLQHPKDHFYFFIGTDNLPALHLWKHLEKILTLATIICFYRKGYELAPMLNDMKKNLSSEIIQNIKTNSLPIELPDVSSTTIREKLNQKLTIAGLTPNSVINKIQEILDK